MSDSAKTPPIPAPGCRQRGAIFLSRPKARARFTASALTRSHRAATSLIKEILVATKAVAASRTSSAVDWLVTMTGTPRIQRMKNLLQHLHRFGGSRSQDQAVGPVEIFDCATIGEEHRLRNDGGLAPSGLDA